MPARTSDRRLKMADLFFGHHDGIEPLPSHLIAESPELADGVSDPLKQAALVLYQIFRAGVSPAFLIADQRQYHVAC